MFDFNPLWILRKMFQSPSYGETLEHYIVSRKPKCPSDVERLTYEWQRSQKDWMI